MSTVLYRERAQTEIQQNNGIEGQKECDASKKPCQSSLRPGGCKTNGKDWGADTRVNATAIHLGLLVLNSC